MERRDANTPCRSGQEQSRLPKIVGAVSVEALLQLSDGFEQGFYLSLAFCKASQVSSQNLRHASCEGLD